MWNLATNGLRAMPGGGRLTLSASPGIDASSSATLTVTDEGVGIAPEELDGIFQPFRGSFGKGSGLGLAIIHRIVSDYNAQIDVESAVGRGTTFRVTFPPILDGRGRCGRYEANCGGGRASRARRTTPAVRFIGAAGTRRVARLRLRRPRPRDDPGQVTGGGSLAS